MFELIKRFAMIQMGAIEQTILFLPVMSSTFI